jgi:hypothetical protein
MAMLRRFLIRAGVVFAGAPLVGIFFAAQTQRASSFSRGGLRALIVDDEPLARERTRSRAPHP